MKNERKINLQKLRIFNHLIGEVEGKHLRYFSVSYVCAVLVHRSKFTSKSGVPVIGCGRGRIDGLICARAVIVVRKEGRDRGMNNECVSIIYQHDILHMVEFDIIVFDDISKSFFIRFIVFNLRSCHPRQTD